MNYDSPYPDPRWSPPPETGFRPPYVREDEWLSYTFGYDPRESDDWIVRRNSSDMENQPLWIGSDCRSLFVHVDERSRIVRFFNHDRRYGEFRLAWQDPKNPLLVHHIGSFQIDRRYYDSTAEKRKLIESLRFKREGNSIFLIFNSNKSIEIGEADQPGPGEKTVRISSLLAHRVLGKTEDEILVRFLLEDEKWNRITQRRRSAPTRTAVSSPARTPERDYQLSFAWDNTTADPLRYTKLRGRLGLFTLNG